MTQEPTEEFKRLKKLMNILIGKIGVDSLNNLLDNFINDTSIDTSRPDKLFMIYKFISDKAVAVFELDAQLFYTCQVTEYRNARMCCYHLLREYTADTLAGIGLAFHSSEKAVRYGSSKIKERLSVPKSHPQLMARYEIIEKALINFLSKLN